MIASCLRRRWTTGYYEPCGSRVKVRRYVFIDHETLMVAIRLRATVATLDRVRFTDEAECGPGFALRLLRHMRREIPGQRDLLSEMRGEASSALLRMESKSC